MTNIIIWRDINIKYSKVKKYNAMLTKPVVFIA